MKLLILYIREFFRDVENPDFKNQIRDVLANRLWKVESPLLIDESVEDELLETIYFYENKTTTGGLACANFWDAIAISFNNLEFKNITELEILKNNILIRVMHASKVEYLDKYQSYFDNIEHKLKFGFTQANFWELKNTYLTKFVFLDKTENEIKRLDAQAFSNF